MLWPDLRAKSGAKAPHVLATLVTHLQDTNSSIVAEFRKSLAFCRDNPEKIQSCRNYFHSVTVFVYDWAIKVGDHRLALEIMLAKRQAALAKTELAFEAGDTVRLAFAHAKLEQWADALAAFEELGETPIRMNLSGPWGSPSKPFLPTSAAAFCRKQLGIAPVQLHGRFDLGAPSLRLHAPSTFAVTVDALWVAVGGKLLKLDLNLHTNFQVMLPVDDDVPMTALEAGPNHIWIGTRGAGLVEFEKATQQCRRITTDDGLLRNDISCLHRKNEVLWIGFGHDAGGGATRLGGLGKLDLETGRVSAFSAPLQTNPLARSSTNPFEAKDDPSGPPRVLELQNIRSTDQVSGGEFLGGVSVQGILKASEGGGEGRGV